jgi:hypothetical protein
MVGEIGEINVLRLAEFLGEHSVLVYQALGWLAREGRIRYRESGVQVRISLRDGPQGPPEASEKAEEV